MRKLDIVLTCSKEWYNTVYDAYLKWDGELNENITHESKCAPCTSTSTRQMIS